MQWVINKDKVIDFLKHGYKLEEWSNGVKGFSYNIGANTVRIETAQRLIKDNKVIISKEQPLSSATYYIWNNG
jgi:GH24 family phage-related lysozyme (muramidase)